MARENGYRIKETTMAIVNKAIVVIKTLWPQRAISPSILTPGKSQKWCSLGVAALRRNLIWVQDLVLQARRGAWPKGKIP
jgi:hypothetical protein